MVEPKDPLDAEAERWERAARSAAAEATEEAFVRYDALYRETRAREEAELGGIEEVVLAILPIAEPTLIDRGAPPPVAFAFDPADPALSVALNRADYFAILGIPGPGADDAEIAAAYQARRNAIALLLRAEPRRAAQLRSLSRTVEDAYRVLSIPALRTAYARALEE